MRGVWLALLTLVAWGWAVVGQAAPLEAYGGLPNIEDAQLSPDGQKLAVILTDGENRNILVKVVETGENRALVRAGEAKLRDIRWAGPDHLLITVSTTSGIIGVLGPRREWFGAQVLDVQTGRVRPLLQTGNTRALNVVIGQPQTRVLDGRPYAIVAGIHFVGNRGQPGAFRVDLQRNRSELIDNGSPHTLGWLYGPAGEPLAKAELDADRGRWALQVRKGSRWEAVRTESFDVERPSLVGLGRTPRSLLVSEPSGEATVLREFDVDNGAWGEPLPAQDVNGLFHDPRTGLLLGVHRMAGDEDQYTFFDPAVERTWKAVAAAYPGQRVRPVSASDDRRRLVVHVDSPTDGPGFAYIDLATGRASWIGNAYQQLKPEDFSPVQPVRYRAADGLELSGYLTLPRGREPKALPLIVLPHGGPAARDSPGFDWWSQGLASRGYAVLRVNYRGSQGFGRAFFEKGFGEWGRKMQTDLSDGVRHLAAQGVIDPNRVCIAGASYGGYAALAGATLDRGVYRCAASVAGPSDLRQMVSSAGGASQRYWVRFMGAENPKDSALSAISPAAHAGAVEIPVLLIHGNDDTVVPLRQSQLMAEALRKAGKPVELVVLKGDDHWLSRGDTRQQMLRAMVAFLETHNPPN